MDDWRTRIAELVQNYFGARGITRSRVALFLRHLEKIWAQYDDRYQKLLQEIICNLQTMTILLRRREADGEPVYVFREGRLAGELTTEKVVGKSPRELFPAHVNAVTLPMVERAFAGEEVEFRYTLGERTFLTLLHPFRRDEQGRVVEVIGSMVDVTNEQRYAAELEHNERLFRTLIEYMPCGVLYEEIDQSGQLRLLVVNAEFTRLTGFTKEMYAAESYEEWSERTHPEDRPHVQQLYRAWLESRTTEPLHLQYRFYDRYGVVRWLDNYLVRIFHDNGCDGVLQIALDITERTTAEQRLQYATSYLEQSIEPIIECDDHFIVTFLNRSAMRIFPGLQVGADLSAHPIGEDLPTVCSSISKDPAERYSSFVQVGNRTFLRLVTRAEHRWRVFCHEVTPLIEAEQTLRRALEREQALNMVRSQFVSTLSHEFRTPLAGILTAAQLLERYGSVMTDEQRRETISSIVSRVRDLEHIIHSFTRRNALLGRDSSSPVPIRLQEFIERVANQIEIIRRRNAQLEYKLDVPHDITIDADLLHAALEAVLDNAARYSPDNETITVSAFWKQDRLVVQVRDRGVGIPPDEIERLFTLYFRSSRTGNIPGTGLSLATIKPLILAVDGKLDVCNHPEGGVVATIEIPCKIEQQYVKHEDGATGE